MDKLTLERKTHERLKGAFDSFYSDDHRATSLSPLTTPKKPISLVSKSSGTSTFSNPGREAIVTRQILAVDDR